MTKSAVLLPATASNDVSERLAHRLRAETEGEVLFDAPSRGRYATDASIYQIMPVGVLMPRSGRDVATALDIARDLKVPVLPRGGGTSQCGQAIGAALVIDNSKYFRRIRALDVERRTAVVEPGLVLEVLSAELTLSPNHTAGWGQLKDDAGLSMRFPRFTGRWRDDKEPQDATTTQQLVELYRTARRAPAE